MTIIINGRGNAGKDTACALAAKCWRVRNVSSITPIKQMIGWNGDKSPDMRRKLAALKAQNKEKCHEYCMKEYHKFMQSDDEILFLHVREPEAIDRLKKEIGHNCYTLLIRRPGQEVSGEDYVEKYRYDKELRNIGTIQDLQDKIFDWIFETENRIND